MDDYYGSIHFTTIRISVLALLAMLHSAEGDEQQALAALSRSIALAEPGGFIRLFVDLGAALKPLLKKLVQQDVSPQYVADLLAAFDAEDTRPGVGHSPRVGADSLRPGSALLTNREQEVLELLAKRYTDKEIAETLYISPGTVRSHIEHLGEKLNATGRHAIVQTARDQGLLA
jgi:LuxR family maltose regulon positive regulatory protein